MRITLLGGFGVEHGQEPVAVRGAGQRALLFRLALDAPAVVSYRALAEDLWPQDPPGNARAALQSVVSRLRSQLPVGSIESEPGGYRLQARREEVDILRFQDLVAAAGAAPPAEAVGLATQALALWGGEPWLPGEQYEWVRDQLLEDRSLALDLGGRFQLEEAIGSVPPAPMTGIVGREAELRSVVAQLGKNRLVTIIGTGGAGKTRLAVEAAGMLRPSLLIELAPVGRAELWQAILGGIGRQIRNADSAQESRSARDRVVEALAGRRLTLVLDNCEHVVAAVAEVVSELLSRLAELRILATSREPLGLLGESFVTLGPLGHPRGRELDRVIDETVWAQYPALELFDRRASAARGSAIEVGELSDAARLVSRLDGLPLALELAAAKLRTMTVAEVADGLDDRFALLGRGTRGSVPRHQTLRALIDWSWGLLSEEEQRTLAWLSVYPAGIPTSAAGGFAVDCAASGDVLDALVDRSLLQRSAGRFRMLETIREYGIERLASTGDTERALTALATTIAAGTEVHDPQLRTKGTRAAIEWFDSEEDNISAALRHAVDAGLGELACRIVVSTWWYWVVRDRFSDAIPWVVQVSGLAHEVRSEAGALLRVAGPLIAHFTAAPGQDEDRAAFADLLASAVRDLHAEREAASGPANDIVQLAPVVLETIAELVASGKGPGDVVVPSGEALGLAPWPTAMLHLFRAATAQNVGDAELLGSSSELAVAMFQELGDSWGLALSRQMRSEWLVLEGRLDEAFEASLASTEGLRGITSSWDLAHQQSLLITILCRQGKWDEAERRMENLLAEARASGFRASIMSNLTAAAFWMSRGDEDRAEEHLEAAKELSTGLPGDIPQLAAVAHTLRADVLLARGDAEGAQARLRAAADMAIASGDHPIIAQVAVSIGVLALERGDLSGARRALDLATVIRGSRDGTDLKVRRIESAVGAAGRVSAVAPTRPAAVEQLGQILRR